jgi:hypothetical protein
MLGGFLEAQTMARRRISALDGAFTPRRPVPSAVEQRGRGPFKISGEACPAGIKINSKVETIGGGC